MPGTVERREKEGVGSGFEGTNSVQEREGGEAEVEREEGIQEANGVILDYNRNLSPKEVRESTGSVSDYPFCADVHSWRFIF
ncbi:hypothetical protein AMTR_s00152p00079240 [Amborella trichopoda]|uniref:Uncharacterized protein n=1 Tax=Amborella trichopoda TaxID=13333 RepID=W1PEV1_AMBTC|nr:hypothetical protein AMTR_s00152p00079240 [Amborella trichopoda]